MADDNGVVIKITGDPKDFEKALEQTAALFDKFSDKGKKNIGIMDLAFGEFVGHLAEKGFEEALNLIGEAFEKLADFMKESIGASSELEQSVTKLNASLAVSGKFTEQSSKQFQEFAETLEGQTNISKNVILQNAAMIESFGNLDEQGLERVTKASLDFAAATGKDAAGAAQLLARASEGQVEALKRAGIVIESTGDNAKDFANALGQIETKFGGAAAALTNTFAGSIAGAKDNFEDLQIVIGDFITKNPAVIAAIKGIGDFFDGLKENLEDNKGSINDFIDNGIQKLIDAIIPAGKILNLFLDGVDAVGIGFQRLEQGVDAVVIATGKIASAIDGTVAAFQRLIGVSDEAAKKRQQQDEDVSDAAGARLVDIQTEIEATKTAAAEREKVINNLAQKLHDDVQTRVDEEKTSQTEITNVTLEQISARRAAADATAAEETERRKQRIADIINETRDIQGKQAAEDLQFNLQKLEGEKKFVEQAKKINDQHAKNQKDNIFAVQKYEELSQKEKIANLQGTLGVISSLQNNAAGGAFEIGKAAAVASATIDGYAAVQKALASAPPPFNFALAAVVGIATAANVSKIAGTNPPTGAAEGALVTGGSGPTADDQPFMLSKGEIVAPAKNFDEVVTGVARERGYKVDGEESKDKGGSSEQAPQVININLSVDYNNLKDPQYINELCKEIREAVDFRGARVG